MITSILKTILTSAGCTMIFYEQDKLANLYLDKSNQSSINGLILQLNQMTLEVKANAIGEHYAPLIIEISQQVELEDNADNNETKLEALLTVCKKIIIYLIAEKKFKKISSIPIVKIVDNKYDANVIGWSMSLDLLYYKNETKDPCI